jgi:hypothetical protein
MDTDTQSQSSLLYSCTVYIFVLKDSRRFTVHGHGATAAARLGSHGSLAS